MVAVLTTICADVVKTAAICKFDTSENAPQRALPPLQGSPDSPPFLLSLAHLGFCKSGPSLKELRGGFTEMEFANGGSFDHLDAGVWSKLAPFVILGPVPLLAKRSPAPSIQRNLRRHPRTGKPAPSLRSVMSLRACRWWGIPSFTFLLVFGSNARTPKWGRRIQANEKRGIGLR